MKKCKGETKTDVDDFLKEAWDIGIQSGRGRYRTIEEIIEIAKNKTQI